MESMRSLNEGLEAEEEGKEISRYSSEIWMNDVVVSVIFGFLDPGTALIFSVLNKTAWAASNNDAFWANSNTLGELWKREEKYLMNSPHKLSGAKKEVSLLMDRIKCMPMSELRRSLALCRVDTNMCTEKVDYRRHLQAALTFEDSLRGKNIGVFTRRTQLSFPDWALKMNEGKASFFHAKRESKRQLITRGELLDSKWAFHFKYAQDQFGNVMLAEALGPIERYDVQFFEDDTLTSSMHEHKMRFTYELAPEDGSNRMTSYRQVRVEQYPPLVPIRLSSGLWRMENQNVVMEQKEGLHDIPLL